jgi:hypothetical protein
LIITKVTPAFEVGQVQAVEFRSNRQKHQIIVAFCKSRIKPVKGRVTVVELGGYYRKDKRAATKFLSVSNTCLSWRIAAS